MPPVFVPNGALRLAPSGSPLHAAFIASAVAYGLNFDLLSASETRRRYPALAAPDGYEAIVEHEAGVLFAARAVRALQDRAQRAGADLRFGERLERWEADGDGVVVHTSRGVYRGARLVITAGAWTSQVVAELGLPLQVERVVNVTFQPVRPELVTSDRLPAFIVHDGSDGIYGVPAIDGHGVKVGASGTPTDPDDVEREIAPIEVQRLRSFVERFLPAAAGSVSEQLTCLYTQAPDGHFVIDRHPEHPQVVIASPCSGHGFKYTTAIGPLLADLAFTGTTRIPIDSFSLARLAALPTGTR